MRKFQLTKLPRLFVRKSPPMYKRFFALLAVLCISVGCGSPTATPGGSTPGGSTPGGSKAADQPSGETSKPKVALIMKSLANEFFSTMADGAKAHQAANSERYELVVNGIKDEQDLARQVAIVEEMVAAGVDAIVIAPADSKALVPALRKAKEKGVVIVNIDNKLDAEVLAAEEISVPFVGPDNRAGAAKVGEFLVSQLGPGAKVAILEGITTSFNAQQRKLGFEDAMKAANVEIVSSQSAKWETSLANTVTASILSEHPEVGAILAANDSMAIGAVAAVKDAGKAETIKVVGFDNISAVQDAIKEGKIVATADQHGDQLAVFGVEHALKLIADPNIELEDIETPVDLVTAESFAGE